MSAVVLTSLGGAKNKAYKASTLMTISGLNTEFIICSEDGGIISGPVALTGGGTICKSNQSPPLGPDMIAHNVAWPNLTSSNTNFCYSGATVSCNGSVPGATVSTYFQMPSPFYVIETNKSIYITCTYNATSYLTCN